MNKNELEIVWIKQSVTSNEYEVTAHADKERQLDKITIDELESVLLKGEIIENYPDNPRGSSCLVLGYGREGCPVHVVCGQGLSGKLRIITVYVPTLPKWINPKVRRK